MRRRKQAVGDANAMTGIQKGVDDVGTDEPGASRDQNRACHGDLQSGKIAFYPFLFRVEQVDAGRTDDRRWSSGFDPG